MIEVEARTEESAVVLAVAGRLDASWAPRLETEIAERVRGGAHHLRLDLAGVSYVSSAGIRVLLTATRQLRAIGGSLAIAAASAAVRSVLELSGLDELLGAAPAAPAEAASEAVERLRRAGVALDVYRLGAPAPLAVSLVGDPDDPSVPGADVELGPGSLAVGIGALGEDARAHRERFGELVAAGGAAAFAPTDGADLPDYVVSAGRLVPRAHLQGGIVCRGALGLLVRFEAEGEAVTLAALVGELLALGGGPLGGSPLGLVMLAESDGLLGAALKRSPATLGPGERMFAHPGVRRFISYTPERQHRRALALIAGVACPSGDGSLGRFVRPLGERGPLAHLHAAALPFSPLPRGRIELEPTLARLLDAAAPLAVLHLLRDDRELSGGGDSALLRGAAWLAPLGARGEAR